MKKDKRRVRDYNLLEDHGDFYHPVTVATSVRGGAQNLRVWHRFTRQLIGLQENQNFNTAYPNASGSIVNSSYTLDMFNDAVLESPSFLQGTAFVNNCSLAINEKGAWRNGYEITGLPGTLSTGELTLSITFKFQHLWPLLPYGDDTKICIFSIADTNNPNGRFALLFDLDGYSGGAPAFQLTALDDTGTTKNSWLTRADGKSSGDVDYNFLRDWIRIDFVVESFTDMAQPDWLGTKANLYVNGAQTAYVGSAGTGGTVSTAPVKQILAGGFSSSFSSLAATAHKAINIGEIAIWDGMLPLNQLNQLYLESQSSMDSGIISNPAKTIIDCGQGDHDAYPTTYRPGDQRIQGSQTPFFNDTVAKAIPVAGEIVNYPTLLSSGTSANRAVGTIIATPNSLPDIYAPAAAAQGATNIIDGYQDCNEKKDFSDPFTPFNDSRMPTNVATKPGNVSKLLPGFSNKRGDRIMIEIDITPTQDTVLQVVSGNNGETFGTWGETNYPDSSKTGLVYFNLRDKKYDPIGGVEPWTGNQVAWCLPGEVSSSEAIGKDWDWSRNIAPIFEDFNKIPRIFQPFPSMIAHRSTYNHIYSPDFKCYRYARNRGQMYTGSLLEDENNGVALGYTRFVGEVQSLWQYVYQNADSPLQAASSDSPLTSAIAPHYGGHFDNDTYSKNWFAPFQNDMLGFGPGPMFGDTQAIFDQRMPVVWNNPSSVGKYYSGSTSGSMADIGAGLTDLLDAVGRPIAYSNWSNNSLFHATESCTIRVSDYIDVPFLLESMEVDGIEVDAHRLHQPKIGLAALPQTQLTASYWSNTNNHVDCLTFFLMRQDAPYGNKATKLAAEMSQRSLITFSNSVFASPYVGWDWSDGYRRRRAYNNSDFTSMGVNTWLAPFDHQAPAGGSRTVRLFEITRENLTSTVNSLDNIAFYSNSNGSAITPYGAGGVFFSATQTTEQYVGHPRGDDVVVANNPTIRYVTASMKLEIDAPVRIASPYAQHDLTILPIIQGQCYPTGAYQGFNDGGGQNYFNPYMVRILSDWPDRVGWQGYFNTGGPSRRPISSTGGENRSPSGPRLPLSCIGRFWPGGTKIAKDRLPLAPKVESGSYREKTLAGEKLYDNWTLPSGINVATKFFGSVFTDAVSQVMAAAVSPTDRMLRFKNPVKRTTATSSFSGKPNAFTENFPPAGGTLGQRFSRSWMYSKPPRRNVIAGTNEHNDINEPVSFGALGYAPNWFRYEQTGDAAYESAAVLMPDDSLIFGAQWSPADPVHRSMRAINHALNPITDVDSVSSWPLRYIAGGFHMSGNILADKVDGLPVMRPVSGSDKAKQGYRYAGYCESNSLNVHASASITIKSSSPSKLRLYGTLLKDSQQKYFSSPQQVVSNAVHEAIGNEPVVDQQDLASLVALTGTPVTSFVAGDMKNNSWYGSPCGAFTDPLTYPARNGRGQKRTWMSGNMYDLGTVRRTITLIDELEEYYDSYPPSVEGIWEVDGASLINNNIDGNTAGGAITTNGDEQSARTAVFTVCDNTPINPNVNGKWKSAFPFEPRYANVEREDDGVYAAFVQMSASQEPRQYNLVTVSPFGATFTPVGGTYNFFDPAKPARVVTEYQNDQKVKSDITHKPLPWFIDGSTSALEGSMILGTGNDNYIAALRWWFRTFRTTDQLAGIVAYGLNNARPSQTVFGIGDAAYEQPNTYFAGASVDGSGTTLQNYYMLRQKPRGFRYGLINHRPQKLQASYRRDSYGQFRDMLEQRKYSKLQIKPRVDDPETGEPTEVLGQAYQNEGAISCTFRTPVWRDPTETGDTVAAAPENTNCSNLSTFATSSLPYFDGMVKNRDALPTSDEVIVT